MGLALRQERLRRRLTLRQVAEKAGLAVSSVHAAEDGRPASLETYVRISTALRLRLEPAVVDPRARPGTSRDVDPVHAAMGEAEAAHFRRLGLAIAIDEPYQHYHFAGRADVLGWSSVDLDLLHFENETRMLDLQAGFGSFNTKREYLAAELASRAGVPRWRSETHVLTALWSAEMLHKIRRHKASFAAVCPDSAELLEAWWGGGRPPAGKHSVLAIFDPIEQGRRDRRRWIGLEDLDGVRPRYRDYADALASLRKVGLA